MKGDLSTAPKKVDLLIVGAGLSGAVIAERCSKVTSRHQRSTSRGPVPPALEHAELR